MTNRNQILRINFNLAFVQRDEQGLIEALVFMDDLGTEITLPYDPRHDYNQGITAEIKEMYYNSYKGKGFGRVATERIFSIANGKEIRNEETIPQEFLITTLFRKVRHQSIKNNRTGEDVELLRYTDAAGNNFYTQKDQLYETFLTEEPEEFMTLSFTYADLQRDFIATQKRYENTAGANISLRSVRKGAMLEENEFDYKILNEIFKGQRRKDEKYSGENFYDIYTQIKDQREAEKLRESEFDYGFIETKQTSIIPTIEQAIEHEKDVTNPTIHTELETKNAGWKRGAAAREAARLQVKEDLARALQRIQELENLLEQQRRENNQLTAEISKVRNEYIRLRRIFDGEDDEFTAVIYPTS